MMRDRNMLVKLIALSLLGIILLWLLPGFFAGTGMGFGFNYRNSMMGGNVHMGTGFYGGFGGGITVLLVFLIKVLFVLFVAGLVVGIAIWVKNTLLSEEDIRKMKSTFALKKEAPETHPCSICGKELQAEWKLCPYCGKDKE